MAKRQHWLPQFYLRGFADEGAAGAVDRIWAFHRNGPEEQRLSSVADLAVQRYLYSPKGENGERDHSVDLRLQELESVLGQMWPSVARGFVDLEREAQRKALSLFVASLHARHPTRIRDLERIHSQIVLEVDQVPKAADGTPLVSHVRIGRTEHAVDSRDWAKFRDMSRDELHRQFTDTIRENTATIARVLLGRRWAVVVSDEPVFATCDTPLVIENPTPQQYGVATPGTVVYLPLSPYRFLIIDDSALPSGYYDNKPGFAEAMNHQTWCAADRYLLSSRESYKVLAGILEFVDAFGI